jgi:NitT/TauT family transport system substrate-binding protein
VKLSGGGAMNDALLAGAIDVGSGGVTPLLTLWDRTRGSASEVKGVAALVSMPYHLLSNRPEVRTIADLGPRDRIALPATGISIQSRTLQMASVRIWGEGQFARLDALQVALPHPEATTALLAGSTEVTAHFSSPPFQYQAVASGKAHKVLSSYDVLGGPATAIMLWAAGRYRPRTRRPTPRSLRRSRRRWHSSGATRPRPSTPTSGSRSRGSIRCCCGRSWTTPRSPSR